MLRNLLRALVVFRLESSQLAVDLELALSLWRNRPVIEIVLAARDRAASRLTEIKRRLDEVYPF